MGMAYWLYTWIILHQTQTTGFVHGGAVVTYADIQKELNMPTRTLKRWMSALHRGGYIEVTYSAYKRMRIRVEKSKKFNHRQKMIQFPESISARSGTSIGPEVAQDRARSGTFNKSSKERYIDSKAEAVSAATLQAFDSLSSTPFGPEGFRTAWTEQYQSMNGGGFTDAMEKTIQQCQSQSIKVPGMFFTLKRQVEKIEIANKFHHTPL
jgi:hypothetical protein